MRWRGLTLIEVLGSLAILGVLVTSLLLGRAHAERQRVRALLKREAVRTADMWITALWNDEKQLPRQASGTASGDAHTFTWQTRILSPSDTNLSLIDQQSLGIECIRLTMCEQSRPDEPLVTVDLALPQQSQSGNDAP